MRVRWAVLLLLALPLAGQQGLGAKVADLQQKIIDLEFKITDLSGNPVSDIAGAVQDLQIKEVGNEVRIDLAADVLFDFDKADLLPKAQETLSKAAAIVKERAKGTVRIEGYTDSKGDDAYNMRLSEKRANAVRDWFRTKGGLSSFKFDTKGLGETQPVAPNQKPDGSDDPEARQKNRRVQIVITK
jgi:outer membrane protein OmpA-like peptidoglycan-associated protein